MERMDGYFGAECCGVIKQWAIAGNPLTVRLLLATKAGHHSRISPASPVPSRRRRFKVVSLR
jgi:hypothetical protein